MIISFGRFFFICLLCSPLLSACGIIEASIDDKTGNIDESRSSEEDLSVNHKIELTEAELPPPLSIEVVKDSIIDHTLYANVRLNPRAIMNSQDVVLEAIGLNNGEVVERVSQNVADLTSNAPLQPGVPLDLEFTLGADRLGEYQIVCAWGHKDNLAEKALSRGRIASPSSGEESNNRAQLEEQQLAIQQSAKVTEIFDRPDEVLVLRNVATISDPETCSKKPCEYRYVVEGQLANYGKKPIRDIFLALGIYWEEHGRKTIYPKNFAVLGANEEKVPLGDFILNSGQSRNIKLTVNRSIPDIPGGRFVPHLRILSGDSAR